MSRKDRSRPRRSSRDVRTDELMGLVSHDDDEDAVQGPQGFWTWLFSSCKARAPITANQAQQKNLKAATLINNQREEYVVLREEAKKRAQHHVAEHLKECTTPFQRCLKCAHAGNARVAAAEMSQLQQHINRLGDQFAALSKQSLALQSVESTHVLREGMQATHAVLSAEIQTADQTGKSLVAVADQMNDTIAEWEMIQTSAAQQFNYTAGQVSEPSGDIDPDVLEELNAFLAADDETGDTENAQRAMRPQIDGTNAGVSRVQPLPQDMPRHIHIPASSSSSSSSIPSPQAVPMST